MKLYNNDCLKILPKISDKSINLILTDPPYGTTACKWDSTIPLKPMWNELKRIIKDNGCIVFFGNEPFSSHLRLSNLDYYRHDWVWEKDNPSGFLLSKKYPLKYFENIMIFAKKTPNYYPQYWYTKPMNAVYRKNKCKHHYEDRQYKGVKLQESSKKYINTRKRFPKDIIKFNVVNKFSKIRKHPKQKPVPLLEYLIKSYTKEKETVLDFSMGSGSTGVACKNLNREFIGIEKDTKYFNLAKDRIESTVVLT